MTDLSCYYCIVEEQGLVPAVTVVDGDAVCERCAREIHEHGTSESSETMVRFGVQPARS